MRVFRKIIVFTVVFFFVVTLASIILVRVFEEELTRFVIDGLNRQIRTEVSVGEVRLSFVKKFPDASLELKDVFIASVPDFQTGVFSDRNTDTLLVAENLFLRFNVLKLLKRQYLVNEVQVQSGKLNICIDRGGLGNYAFWDKKEVQDEKSFFLNLDNVNLADILVQFDNRALGIDIQGSIKKSYFKGQFSRESYTMSAGVDGLLNHYVNEGTVFFQDQDITSDVSLKIDPRSITIEKGNFNIAGQHILLSGEILRPAPLDLNLKFEGKQLDIENIINLITLNSKKVPDDLKAGGSLDFMGQIKGQASNTQMPWIKAEFLLKEGWIKSQQIPKDIIDIKTKGNYSNGIRRGPQTTTIQLNGVSMKIGNSRIGGDYSVVNLVKPDFNYKIKTELDLSDLQEFINPDTTNIGMKGRLLAEIEMSGSQTSIKNFKKTDLLKFEYNAKLHLEEISLNLKEIPLEFKDFYGDAIFTDHLEVENLNGVFEDSQVSMSGRMDNLLEYLLTSSGNLWMDVDIYSERMDLNHLRSFNARPDKIKKADSVFLPERLYLKTRFWFDELQVKDFKASQITGNLIYKPKRLSINRIELLSMGGRIVSEGILEQREEMHFLVKSMSEISDVDITKVFSSFNNFGQEFIQDRHLMGSLTGTVNFSAGLDEKMKIKKKTILADCDVVIRDGELSGFEPMTKLSRFIDVEELESIKFSTLTNEIFIRNEEVVIPRMDISSSAADITASGIHGFNKHFTYKMKVALSELRSKRSARIRDRESEFGEIEEDGLGRVYIYLIIEGTPDGTDVRYDRRGAMQNIREQMKEEKQELKQILNEELGLFKKDSSLNLENRDEPGPAFIIEWDEDADTSDKRDIKQYNNSDKERFIIEWDEDELKQDSIIPKPKRRIRKKKKQ